jgi:hypothetical protein
VPYVTCGCHQGQQKPEKSIKVVGKLDFGGLGGTIWLYWDFRGDCAGPRQAASKGHVTIEVDGTRCQAGMSSLDPGRVSLLLMELRKETDREETRCEPVLEPRVT